MRKRKAAVVGFLTAAALTIGIGYAALSDTLDITGRATITRDVSNQVFDSNVYFAEPVVSDAAKYDAHYESETDKDHIVFNVFGLTAVNESITMNYTIKNDSGYDVNVTLNSSEDTPVTNTNASHFELTYTDAAGITLTTTTPIEIAAGSSADVKVTVKLLAFTTDVDVTASFAIGLLAQSAT